jgi:hypothetical protein
MKDSKIGPNPVYTGPIDLAEDLIDDLGPRGVYDRMLKEGKTIYDGLRVLDGLRCVDSEKEREFLSKRKNIVLGFLGNFPSDNRYVGYISNKLDGTDKNYSLRKSVQDLFLRRGDYAGYNKSIKRDIRDLSVVLPGAEVLNVRYEEGPWPLVATVGLLAGGAVIGDGTKYGGITVGFMTAGVFLAAYGAIKAVGCSRKHTISPYIIASENAERRILLQEADLCDRVIGNIVKSESE